MSHEYIEIRESALHNMGGFAAKDIPKGAKVIQYLGEKITKGESEKRELMQLAAAKRDPAKAKAYLFELNEIYDLDGDIPENDAKYINHSCEPNLEVDIINDEIWLFSLKNITKGEEVTYDYGFEMEKHADHPCYCRAAKCIGYIVSEKNRAKLKEKLSNDKVL